MTRRSRCLARLLVFLFAAALPGAGFADRHWTLLVHFIDVGQGDAVLIQLRNKNILYDCGDTGKGKDVLEYLEDHDVKELDLLVASHAHKDHIGGCLHILQKMNVKSVYDNGSPSKTGTYTKFKKLAREKSSYRAITGDFKEGDLEFHVAYDTRPKLAEADRSVMVKIVHGQVGFLFTGDCEESCERELLKDANLDVDVLLVGHHGSADSSTEDFLRRVTPRVAVIQVGAGNPYGHPRKEALDRLKAAGAKVYRTDLDGSVIVMTDGREIEVEVEK